MSESVQHQPVALIARVIWDRLDADRRRGDPSNGTARIGRETGTGVQFVACRVREGFPLFSPGHTVMTTNAARRLEAAGALPESCFRTLARRHLGGDWGVLALEDHEANDRALLGNERLFSAYNVFGERVWIITEADRSITTLLLPEDY
jgi:hypothetical protein